MGQRNTRPLYNTNPLAYQKYIGETKDDPIVKIISESPYQLQRYPPLQPFKAQLKSGKIINTSRNVESYAQLVEKLGQTNIPVE